MEILVYRSTLIELLDSNLIQACLSLCLSSKNQKNTGLYLVRNVLSSFDLTSKCIKISLTDNQIEVLRYVNQCIDIVNSRRVVKNNQREKQVKIFNKIDSKSSANDFWQVLDPSLLDQMMRYRVNDQGLVTNKLLPARIAEQIRMQITSEFRSWQAASTVFKSNSSGFTGKPRMPGYLDKNDLNLIKINYTGFERQKHLPSIKNCSMFLDFGRQHSLSQDALQAYKSFDMQDVQNKLRNQLSSDLRIGSKFVEFRIIPVGRKGQEGIEIVGIFECKVHLDDNNLLAQLKQKTKIQEIPEKYINDFYQSEIEHLLDKRIAGGDVGLNNLLSIAFNTGDKGIIISNQRLEKKIQLMDGNIDALKGKLTTTEHKLLQTKQDELRKKSLNLDRDELIRLRTLQRSVFDDIELQDLISKRQSWLKNALHVASRGVVDTLIEKKIEVLIIGKNKGWKQECELGKSTNRRFLATAHAKFIELLRYKCEDAGILLIETEESYTSKTSFALNHELKIFNQKDKNEVNTDKTPASSHTEPQFDKGYRRSVPKAKSKAQHQYVSQCSSRWKYIHADINGAYNMIRKVQSKFKVNNALSSEFELYWVSPRGLCRFVQKSNLRRNRDSVAVPNVQ